MNPDSELIVEILKEQNRDIADIRALQASMLVEIENLKARASWWGAISGALVAIVPQLLGGC